MGSCLFGRREADILYPDGRPWSGPLSSGAPNIDTTAFTVAYGFLSAMVLSPRAWK